MLPSSADALNLYYPASLAAYSAGAAHVIIGNSFVVSDSILVDPVAAAAMPIQHLPLLNSMLKMNSAFGFIAKRPGAVFMAFRGTETPEEWLCDFEAVPGSCKIASGSVHEGFQRVYECVRASALKGLNNALQPGDRVFITGHSLGAALALLCAIDNDVKKQGLQVCTFAGPRVGLANFQQTYNANVPDTLRVVNRWDIVPNVPVPAPPLCLYEHVGQALVIDGGFTFDLKQAHSLPLSYLPGLKHAVA